MAREYQHGTILDDIVSGFKKHVSPALKRKQEEKVAIYGGYDTPITKPIAVPESAGIMQSSLPQSKLTPDQSIQQVSDVAKQVPEMPRVPSISGETPENNIATLEGWKPKQDVLPGNDFNKANTEDYLKQTGYIPDDDPRMQRRRAEAQDVQAMRLKFIEDSQAGKFSLSGAKPTIQDRQLASAERIAGVKAQQLAGAKQAEFKQKRDIASEKLTSTPKGLYADLFKIPGYMNAATTIDELPFDDPRRAGLIEEFNQIEGGMNYSAYTALKDRIAN